MTSAGESRHLGPAEFPRAGNYMTPELAEHVLIHRRAHPKETMRDTHVVLGIKILLSSFRSYMNKFERGKVPLAKDRTYDPKLLKPKPKRPEHFNVLMMKW